MREIRKLYRDDLRGLCIEKKWFTKGNNEDYSRVLNMADSCEDIQTQNIVNIAEQIKFYSITEQEVESICFDIARICNSFFESVMVIAGRREVLHVYDVTDNDRELLKIHGFEFFENDINDNEMWDREFNYAAGEYELPPLAKTYYSVTTTVYDDGRVVAAVTDSGEFEFKPEYRCCEKGNRDIHTDWFDSIEEAKAFVEEVKKA